jgi:hypothetical protein
VTLSGTLELEPNKIIIDHRINNLAESGAGDQADGEIDDIAAHREFFEFGQHLPVPPTQCLATCGVSGGDYASCRRSHFDRTGNLPCRDRAVKPPPAAAHMTETEPFCA